MDQHDPKETSVTALAFRNVDASPDDPVSEWPQEAIQTALERGASPFERFSIELTYLASSC